MALSDDDRDNGNEDRRAVAAHARVSATRLRQAHAVRQNKSGATVATCDYRKRTAVKSARDGDASGTRADETRGQRHVRTTHAATDTPGACAHDIARREASDAVGGARGAEVSTPVATGLEPRDSECGRRVNMYWTCVDPSTVTHAFTLADPTPAWLILNGVKRIENRNFAIRPGWYAVHVSQKSRVTKEREASLRGMHAAMPAAATVRCGCIHGLCYVRGVIDAAAACEDPWYDAAYTRANEITAYMPFEQPVGARKPRGVAHKRTRGHSGDAHADKGGDGAHGVGGEPGSDA